MLKFFVMAMFLTANAFSQLVGELPQAETVPPVELLPHQKFPIKYLVDHPEVKGLLVNHFMGTGKTFLALGAAEELKNPKVLILGPRFLQAHWLNEMRLYKIKDPDRYEFISYEEAPQRIGNRDLSNTLLILDEGHNLIRYFKSTDLDRNRIYSDLYVKLRAAQRIIVLTGTPIYNNEHDLAYILNLVTGQDIFPFNEQQFLFENTKILRGRSLWRGYIAESLLLQSAFPTFIGFIAGAALASFIAFPIASGVASLVIPLVSMTLAPVDKFPLRMLDAEKFSDVASRYVSFHEIENLDLSDFPQKNIHFQSVSYNQPQLRYFFDFIDGTLNDQELLRLLRENQVDYSPVYLHLNSTLLQNNLRFTYGTGREIGNFAFETKEGNFEEAPKFVEILEMMKKANMPQAVVYSSYYDNGILAFAEFLDRHALSDQYQILDPDLSVPEQSEMVTDFNSGKTKILLLHPDITEGISLKKARQFHLLEPVLNRTVFDQVISRAVRFHSHSDLPEGERLVDIYVWKSVINDLDLSTLGARYENWRERFSEINNWAGWGRNQNQVDKNHDRKLLSPDEYAAIKLDSLSVNIEELKSVFKNQSIERHFGQSPAQH